MNNFKFQSIEKLVSSFPDIGLNQPTRIVALLAIGANTVIAKSFNFTY